MYYESMLGEESGYYLPGATINPTNCIFGMYHSNCLLCEEISFGVTCQSRLQSEEGLCNTVAQHGHKLSKFRCVYHWGVPRSLEQYFQEVGRGEGGVGMVLPRKRSCYSVIHNLKHEFCMQSTIDYCQSNTCL